MSLIEWFVVGVIVLFFMAAIIITWRSLIVDILYYREKMKNVKKLERKNQKEKEGKYATDRSTRTHKK
jgi:hypothetical protein